MIPSESMPPIDQGPLPPNSATLETKPIITRDPGESLMPHPNPTRTCCYSIIINSTSFTQKCLGLDNTSHNDPWETAEEGQRKQRTVAGPVMVSPVCLTLQINGREGP